MRRSVLQAIGDLIHDQEWQVCDDQICEKYGDSIKSSYLCAKVLHGAENVVIIDSPRTEGTMSLAR